MLTAELFLGFPVDGLFAGQLEKTNPHLVREFINETGEYLLEIQHHQMRYIGKKAGFIIELPKLELLQKNIYSLLKRLVPNFPYEETPLYLLSLFHDRV